MGSFRGRVALSAKFVFRSILPAIIPRPKYWKMLPNQLRRYLGTNRPEEDVHVSQVAIRCTEVCDLRCPSCGQWGENGWLLEKQRRGEKLASLSWETARRLIHETKRDHPFYYVWGGEPTVWKPLLPFFEELGRNDLLGSIVTNCHNLEPLIEPLIDTGGVAAVLVSLDGWDAASQNRIRTPAGGGRSDNFERTMRCVDKIEAYKRRLGARFPLIIPITVISNLNHMHLAEIHGLVREKTQFHPYYYGWFITEERARQHEAVFERRFGYRPHNHLGYVISVFSEVDPTVTAQQVQEVHKVAQGYPSVPAFFPDIYSAADIRRYYNDHSWTAGYPRCHSIYCSAEISPDGRMTPCRDYQDYECGNINERSFYEIWNGKAFKAFRREMQKGLMPVCTRCCGLQGL
jgi:radical SAM protein with 4Fe4S-binding SPASM domain